MSDEVDSTLEESPDLLLKIYVATFGNTFNAWKLMEDEKKAVALINKAFETGKPITDEDFGVKDLPKEASI